MSSVTSERSSLLEYDAGHWINALSFTADGENLISGGSGGVRVWQVKNGKRVATMPVKEGVRCVAVSKNSRWIAAGSNHGDVLLWDTTTCEQIFADEHTNDIQDIDFSPNSAQLIAADGNHCTATIWNVAVHGFQVRQRLDHNGSVTRAKYSPQGDRIATAAHASVWIWDSGDGRLLVSIDIPGIPSHGLHWFNNHQFVVASGDRIKQINASGTTVSEWSVPNGDSNSCIALLQHRRFLVYYANNTITFWDTSTQTQLSSISQNNTPLVALSPNGQLLAIASQSGAISIECLSPIAEPELHIDGVVLDLWKRGELARAAALLTAAIPTTQNTAHVLASRALVHARLGQWDAAVDDAKESTKIQPSVIGHIATCMALVGKGDKDGGYRACDIAFRRFQSHVSILLLIKAIVMFWAGECDNAILRMDDLITTLPFNPTLLVVQAYMHLFHGNVHMKNGDCKRAIQSYEQAQAKLGGLTDQPPLIVVLIAAWEFDDLAITVQQRYCEALFSAGRRKEAGESALRMLGRKVNTTEPIKLWVCNLVQQCLSTPEYSDNASLEAHGDDKLTPPGVSDASRLTLLLRGWARLKLITDPWENVLAATGGFLLPRFIIYQVICELLEITARVMDAIACLHQMCSELAQELGDEKANWAQGFRSRCCRALGNLGDAALNAGQYDKAISQYTVALSLDPVAPQDLLVKRSKARTAKGLWDDALDDADKVINFDPCSPLGYERKHDAFRGAGKYKDARDALNMMLKKMSESSNPEIREQGRKYVTPEKMADVIRATIRNTLDGSPPVLINTASGRLYDKTRQFSAFHSESMPIFMELISIMTTEIDDVCIQEKVGEFYRYATLSHKWEEDEPLFDKVTQVLVCDLEESLTHDKLKMFCKVARAQGFNWAWSDTCCINKENHFVLQEALISMFKWYEGSSMTIIFLRGVYRLSLRGALMESIWNKRGWTLQEYHASKVVRFYTEDWTPYLNLGINNHKESPEIISEMEEATNISARDLMALRPGLDDIRKKLLLASSRETTRVEDAAYSLLGIFSVSLPVMCGEGDRALGRLLAQLLASSGDASVLAWTGRSGGYNSCLPASITVFNQLPTSHIPPPTVDAETTPGLLSSPLVTVLHNQLSRLPVPSFNGRRMKLPCLTFNLKHLSVVQSGSGYIFHAHAYALGDVEIITKEDLSNLDSLRLIHPWIDILLDRCPVGGAMEASDADTDDRFSVPPMFTSSLDRSDTTSTNFKTLGRWFSPRLFPLHGWSTTTGGDVPPQSPTASPEEKRMHDLQFITRLQQPFDALLLTPIRRDVEYRRVAADSLITVRLKEITPAVLEKLINDVRTLDVL